MKKIENSFAVTGAFLSRSAVQTRQVKKPLMFPLSWGLKPGERMKHWIPSMY